MVVLFMMGPWTYILGLMVTYQWLDKRFTVKKVNKTTISNHLRASAAPKGLPLQTHYFVKRQNIGLHTFHR